MFSSTPSAPYNGRVKTALRILLLLVVAGAVGTAANALSPRGLSWTRPLGRGIAAQVADAGLVPVDLKTAQELVRTKSTWIIDARPADDYRIGRLPGADTMPWKEDAGISSTPIRQRPILVYCSNEFCEDALKLGMRLRHAGYQDIAVFVDGYEAWWNARGPVEQD
jgi:rhodanese-related sulfurtransferase